MEYSRKLDALPRKITFPIRKSAAQDLESVDDLAALVLAVQDANLRKPADLSPAGYAQILDVLDSLDAITVPAMESGGIAECAHDEDTGNALEYLALEPVPAVSSLVYDTPTTPNTHNSAPRRTHHRFTSKRSPKPLTSLQADQKLKTAQLLRLQVNRSWKHLRPHERVAVIAKQTLLTGALDITVNLSHKRQAELMAVEPAKRAKWLADAMQYQFRNVFGASLPLAFVLEISPAGNIHAHGFIATEDHSPAMIEKVRSALQRAGGMIDRKNAKGRVASDRQVVVRSLRDLGWARYLEKDTAKAIDFLGTDKVDYSSQALGTVAREAHEEERRRLKALKVKKTAVATHTAPPAPSNAVPAAQAQGSIQRPAMVLSGIPALLAEVARANLIRPRSAWPRC